MTDSGQRPIAQIRWKNQLKDKEFAEAHEYLALRLTPVRAEKLIGKLRDAPLTERRVNDLLRACDRDPLPLEDRGVKWQLDAVVEGKKLPPVMVVSFDGIGGDIAEGFHALSLAYRLDPFMVAPVLIAYEGA